MSCWSNKKKYYVTGGTDDGQDDMEEGSVGREVQQDGKNAGRKLSAKTIKAILELICDEAVSQGGRGGRDIW